MTAPSEIIRQSDLINQIVIDRTTLEELGRVEVLWMHPPIHRVLGFICKSGLLGAKKTAFRLDQIAALGSDGVLTDSAPDVTNAERVKRLESLLHHELWTDNGDQVGKITDCLFDVSTGEITHYLFVSGGWSGIVGEIYQFTPGQIASIGKRRVLVTEASVEQFPIYREGLPQKLTKTGQQLKNQLKEEVVGEWRSLTQQAQTVTDQTKGRLQTLAEKARDRAQQLSQQAKETIHTLNEQMADDAELLQQQAKERGQGVAGQLREYTQPLGKQVEDGIQTLTVHAEEIFDAVADRLPMSINFNAPAAQPAPADDWDDEDDWEEDARENESWDTTSRYDEPWDDEPSQKRPWENKPKPDELRPDQAADDDEPWNDPDWIAATAIAPPMSPSPTSSQPTSGNPPTPPVLPQDTEPDDDDEPWI